MKSNLPNTLVDRLNSLNLTSQYISTCVGKIITNPLIMKEIYQDGIPNYFEKNIRGQAPSGDSTPSGDQVIEYLKFKNIIKKY